MKRNKWIIFLTCLLMIFTPTAVFARGFHGGLHGGFHGEGGHGGGHTEHVFHDDGGTGHEFHDDDGGTGHEYHDEDENGNEDNTGINFDDEDVEGPQSLGSRIKDTFNYLLPQKCHSHHSHYYYMSSQTYDENQCTALDQLFVWIEEIIAFLGVCVTIRLLILNNGKHKKSKTRKRIDDWISNILSYKDPVRGRHSIKNDK